MCCAHLSHIQPASGAAPRASFIHPVSSWRSAARIFHTSSQFLAQRHAHLSYIQPASGAAQPRKRTARTLRIGCPLYGRLPGGVVDAEELPPLAESARCMSHTSASMAALSAAAPGTGRPKDLKRAARAFIASCFLPEPERSL